MTLATRSVTLKLLKKHAELAKQQFNLLEKLAEYIADLVLKDFGAPWVRVSIGKLGLISGVRRVGVIIERGTRTDQPQGQCPPLLVPVRA